MDRGQTEANDRSGAVVGSGDSSRAWPRRVLVGGLIFSGILIVLMLLGSTPEDRAVGLATGVSGLYTLVLYATRTRWLPLLAARPLRNAVVLGSINAALVETVFLGAERLYGAHDVAAHPNLIVDLVVTMPWYIGMVMIFVRVQHRRRFALATVLLLGGLYEIGSDGLLGGLVTGEAANPLYFLLLPTVAFWIFVPVYSSLVLPPALVVATGPAPPRPAGPAWRDAVRPLWWLLPYVVYFGVLLVVLAGLGVE